MILVYCRDPRLMACVAEGLTDEMVSVVPSWRRFTRPSLMVECAVVVLPVLEGPRFTDLCDWSRRTRPPAVLVTSFDMDNLVKLTAVLMDELVCVRSITRHLRIAVSAVRNPSPLCAVERHLTEHPSLPYELRIALISGCRAAAPPRTVAEYAAPASCHKSTLYRQFRRCNPTEDRSLGDFVDWVLLVRALQRLPGNKLSNVAGELGVDEKTLRRIAERLTGRRLSAIRSTGLGEAVRLFHVWLTACLPRACG
jgi:AraC-like DNA-binding protein